MLPTLSETDWSVCSQRCPVRFKGGWLREKESLSISQESPKARGRPRKRAESTGRLDQRLGAALLLPLPRPPLRASSPPGGWENSPTWRLVEVDAMAETRGGSLGRDEGTGPRTATSSGAWSSPKRAQVGDSRTPEQRLPFRNLSRNHTEPEEPLTLLTKLPQSRAPPGSRPASGLSTSAFVISSRTAQFSVPQVSP